MCHSWVDILSSNSNVTFALIIALRGMVDDRGHFFSNSHAADKELKSSGSHISMLLFKPPNQSTKSNDYLC